MSIPDYSFKERLVEALENLCKHRRAETEKWVAKGNHVQGYNAGIRLHECEKILKLVRMLVKDPNKVSSMHFKESPDD